MEKLIGQMRDRLDEMAGTKTVEPEHYKINAIRFVEIYRLMRLLEQAVAADADDL